ncbi:MAG: tetratricopeptide repeat protein [Candidatus Sumerlaeia bacterium]|nr:tetratricopeptide repeat protein [Candidatus Sumerlaeia bacterium]
MDHDLKPSHIVAVFPFALNREASPRQADLCRGLACYFQRRLAKIPGVDARLQVLMADDPNGEGKGWLLADAPFSVTQAQSFPFQPGFEPTHLLHGSFLWDRAAARAEVVLIDMQSGVELIHEHGDGPLDEMYPRLVGLVGSVTAELVGSTSTGRLAARFPTKSTEAFERQLLGLAGLQAWNRGVAGPETAFHYFNSALNVDPTFREAAGELELLAEICLEAGDRDEKLAVSALEKAHRTVPDHVGLTSLLGFYLASHDEKERGVELLKRAVDADPFSRHGGRALRRLSQISREAGHVNDARRFLLRAVRVQPEDAVAWEELGYLHDSMGNSERAENAWLRSLQEDPDRPGVLIALGRAWAEKRRYKEATPLFQRASTLATTSTETLKYLAECLVETGQQDEADALVTAWVEEQPDDVEGWLRLASVRRVVGQTDAAQYCIERATALGPSGEQEAQLELERFALNFPDKFREWLRLEEEEGKKLGRSNSAPLLAKRMEAVLEGVNPLPPRFRKLAVRIAENVEDWPLAARHQSVLTAMEAKDPKQWDHLADLQQRALDPTGAEKSLREGITLVPSDAGRLVRLALLLKEMDRGPEAIAVLKRAGEAAPEKTSIKRLALQWREEEQAPPRPKSPDAKTPPPSDPGVSFGSKLLRLLRGR